MLEEKNYNQEESDKIDNLLRKYLGQLIAKRRKNSSKSQRELAKLLGVSQPTITKIEKGRLDISMVQMYHLSKILDFSLVDLVKEFVED